MKIPPPINKQYRGRPSGDTMPVNLSLSRDAVALLRQMAPGARAHGQLVSRLIREHARREELQTFINNDIRRELFKVGRAVCKELHIGSGT